MRDTLAPLVRDAEPEAILALRVLDPSMGSGTFLVGACHYLAAAYESALIDCGRCHPTDLGPVERASIRRTVAERCLFGVDINPTAVQLARLSLWLTTLAADRPLTFLDHHLRVGDSLAGTWLSRLRRPPTRRSSPRPLPLFPDANERDAIQSALPVRFTLALEPNDTAEQVRAKERALAALMAPDAPLARWGRVADAWCAAWLASPPVPASAFAELSETILTSRLTLPRATSEPLLERVRRMSASRRLFHWEIEFPEVFFNEHGMRRPDAGFDAIVGNPPWDMVRADGTGDRADARMDAASLVRFCRESGVYDTRAEGHANRYQLFVERSLALTRPGGRIGLVLPSGILADAGSAPLRRLLFSRTAVERIVGFDNRSGTFPIHRSVRFVLLSLATGTPTVSTACRFGETDPSCLAATERGLAPDMWFPVRVTPSLLERLSGPDLSVPDLRTPLDLALIERAADLFPPLGSVDGWHAQFGRELNVTDDRDVLEHEGTGWPVVEGKNLQPFRVDVDSTRWTIAPADARARIGPAALRRRLAYRDVASATNRVTLIAALLPAESVSTHTLFCLRTALPVSSQQVLCALFNSLVVNYIVRMRVSTHVTTAIVERLPIPGEDDIGPWSSELEEAAASLSRRPDDERLARLNAIVAKVYRLSRDDFRHVLDTFPLVDVGLRARMLDAFIRF
ncbi:MAG: Eco57I restriction-modification methylase domain-containing protein [Vicinamibacterales bacterium]